MNTFDVVMEKSFDSRMENRMKKSTQEIENINASGIINEIKKELEEAQKAKKNGNKTKARKLYSSCKRKLKSIEASLNRNYDILTESGDPKGKDKKIIISSILAIVGMLISYIKLKLTPGYDIKGIMSSFGIAAGSSIGYLVYNFFLNKKDETNYKKFAKTVSTDPISTYKELKYIVRGMLDEIDVAMTNI